MKVISIKQISEELNIEEGVIFREIQKLIESPDSFEDGRLRFSVGFGENTKIFIIDHNDLSFINNNAEKGPLFLAGYFGIDRDILVNLIEQMMQRRIISPEVYRAIFEVKDKPALKSWFEPDVIRVGDSSFLCVEIYAMDVIDNPVISLDMPYSLEIIERTKDPEKILPGRFIRRYKIKAEKYGEYKVTITLEGTVGGRKLLGVPSTAFLKVKTFPPEIEVDLLTPQEISATLNREFSVIFQIRNVGRGDCLNMSLGGLNEYKDFAVISGAHVGDLAPSGILKHTLRLKPRKSGKFTLDKLCLQYQDAEGKTESKRLPSIDVEVRTLQPELKVDLVYPTATKIKENQEFPLTIRVINIGKGEARTIFMRLPIPPELIISGPHELFIPKLDAGSSEEFELLLRAPKESELRINAFYVEFADEENNKRVEMHPGILIPIIREEYRPIISEKQWPFIPGAKIRDRYYIIKEIGEGGKAKVYLAEELITRKKVALKALKPQFIKDQEKINRLIREAEIVRDLRHQNIVAVYYADMEEYEGEKYPFIVMEYLPDTLQKRLIPGQPYELNEVIKVLHDMCEALLAAHGNKPKIIHCDIKPSNIFYSKEKDLWKLGDFGLSVIMLGKEAESEGGSLFYMAPEVLHGKVTEKSDIYSLGIMMREMLTGKISGDLSQVRAIYRDFDETLLQELITLVEKMTERDPVKRPDLIEVYRTVEKIRSYTLH